MLVVYAAKQQHFFWCFTIDNRYQGKVLSVVFSELGYKTLLTADREFYYKEISIVTLV